MTVKCRRFIYLMLFLLLKRIDSTWTLVIREGSYWINYFWTKMEEECWAPPMECIFYLFLIKLRFFLAYIYILILFFII